MESPDLFLHRHAKTDPGIEIIPVSAKTGDNMDKLVSYFEKKIEKQRA